MQNKMQKNCTNIDPIAPCVIPPQCASILGMDHDMVDARATECPICFGSAVCEIADDGSWQVRCEHCGSAQYGLPICEPPPALGTGAVALGFDWS